MNEELKLKVIIDGHEAVATLQTVDAGIDNVVAGLPNLEDKFTKTYSELSSELLKYSAVTEQSTDDIAQWILSQNLSIETIEDAITQLQNEARAVGINSEAWKQKGLALANLKSAYAKAINQNKDLGNSTKPVVAGANKMNLAFNQMGYVMNDASVFAIDFRMGMMGISNNIPMVVQMLNAAKLEIKDTGGTMKQALTSAIMGPGGLMIAVNGLMLLLTVLPGLFGDTTKEIEKQADEVKGLREEYDRLSAAEKERKIGMLKADRKRLEEEKKQYEGTEVITTKYGRAGEVSEVVKHVGRDDDKLEEANKKIEEIDQQLGALNQSFAFTFGHVQKIMDGNYDLSTINKVKDAISLLNKEIEDERSFEQREKYLNRIKELEKLQSSMSGDKLFKEEFKNKVEELELEESHFQNMAEIQGANELILLQMKAEALQKKIALHRQYGEEVKDIEYELLETQKELEVKLKIDTEYEIETPEDEELPDINIVSSEQIEKAKIQSIDDEFERQRKLADFNYMMEEKKYKDFAKFSDLQKQLKAAHTKAINDIDKAEAQSRLNSYMEALSIIGGALNENTAVAKAAAVAQAIINTYEGATKALAQGGILGPALAGVVIASGMASVGQIVATETPQYTAYGTGGAIVGDKGIEILAPAKDFASGMDQLVIQTVNAIERDLSSNSGRRGSQFDEAALVGIEKLNENLEKYAQRPIIINDKAVQKIGKGIKARTSKGRV